MDYGKFKYEQAKREKESRKHQKQVALREVRMKPKIDVHDLDFKARTAAKLLAEGDKVKVSVMFRGREITHPQIGRELLERVHERVKDVAIVERPPALEGRFMTMILSPAQPKAQREQHSSDEQPVTQGSQS
jgi:translation initiation factor IF-3